MYLAGLRDLSFKGVAKPHPFVKFKGYGTFTDFIVKDSPAQAISDGTTGGSAVFSDVLVDNKDGDTDSLGHNTDGFDVSASDVTITGSTVYNQDDCVAINSVSSPYSDISRTTLMYSYRARTSSSRTTTALAAMVSLSARSLARKLSRASRSRVTPS